MSFILYDRTFTFKDHICINEILECNKNRCDEYIRQQPHRDEKSQLNATNGSSTNNDEILRPPGRLQLVPKQHYTHVKRNSCP